METLRKPKAKRSSDALAPPKLTEPEVPETTEEWFKRWCRECDERRGREGPPYPDPPPTMEEIVAIIKEVRAEMWAEGQEQKNATRR